MCGHIPGLPFSAPEHFLLSWEVSVFAQRYVLSPGSDRDGTLISVNTDRIERDDKWPKMPYIKRAL